MSDARPLPSNPEAERNVLGAVLVSAACWPSAATLRAGDFHDARHRAIFGALAALAERGIGIDLVTVRAELEREPGGLNVAGGVVYLAGLLDGVPRVDSVAEWAAILRQYAARREMAEAARSLYRQAVDMGTEPAEALDGGMRSLLEIGARARPQGWPDNRELTRDALALIEARAEAEGGIIGLRTGIADLDAILQGIGDATMGIVGARTGVGKSLLALQIADEVARTRRHALYFSLEMSARALTVRRLAMLARTNPGRLHLMPRGQREEELAALARATATTVQPWLAIRDDVWEVPAMAAAAEEYRRGRDLALIVIDYAQLCRPTRKREMRHLEIRDISADIRGLATRLGVPVLCLAQLNRASEARTDKRPSGTDIADGDSLLRDADWCVLIHREFQARKGASAEEVRALRWQADLIVAKNREGMTGTARCRFNRHALRFEDPIRNEEAA